MEIRSLEEADADIYFALRLEGLETEPLAFGRSAEEYRLEPLEAVAARLKSGEAAFTLGAFLDGALVGAATFVRHANLKERHKGGVFAVYVRAAARGRGVGRALLEELIGRARALDGLEQLSLSVSTTQAAAQRLYRSLGFEDYGLERRALKAEGRYVDEAHMVLFIKPPTNNAIT